MAGIEAVRTERLIGERLRLSDFGEVYRMDQDPLIMATLGGLRSEERTRQWLQENMDQWERHGFGLWMFRLAADGSFVGRGGLRKATVEGREEVEVAYALRPEWWGRGFATEIAAAAVEVGFGPLGLAELVCFTLHTNRASQRVMEKVGFRYERDCLHAGLPHVLYRLRACSGKQFTARQASA